MTLPIVFNNIPGSGLVAPMLTFEVNSGGQYSSSSRLLLVGHKTSAGAAAVNTPVPIGSLQDADVAFGPGSMLREMVRIARQNAPVQELWAAAVTDAGTAQTWILTVGAAAAGASGYAALRLQDEQIALTLGTTDTTTTIAAALAAAINGYSNPQTGATLPVTAAAASAVVTLTSRHLGLVMSDLEVYVPPIAGNLFAGTGLVTAAGTAATGSPTLTTLFAALGDDQYDGIVVPFSDATSLAACSALLADVSGRWSYARQSYGHIFTVSTGALSAQTTLGLSINDRHLTIVPRLTGSPHLPYLWVAGMAARVMPWLGDYVTGNAARNQTDLVVQGLTAPRDRTSWWQYAARNTLVQSGISTWRGNLDGSVGVDKLVTTQRTGAGGMPDATFRDVQAIFQLTHILRYMRTILANATANKVLAALNPGNLGSFITTKDIKATCIGAYDQLARWGLVQDVRGFAAALNVQANSGNPNRVDLMIPIDRTKPLDVVAANAVLMGTGIPAQ